MNVLAVLLFTVSVSGSELLVNPTDICRAAQAGKKGAWLAEPAIKRCLQLDLDKDKYVEELEGFRMQIISYERERDFYKTYARDCQGQVDALANQVMAQDQLAKRLEEQYKRWYHNPWIVGVLGISAGALGASILIMTTRK